MTLFAIGLIAGFALFPLVQRVWYELKWERFKRGKNK